MGMKNVSASDEPGKSPLTPLASWRKDAQKARRPGPKPLPTQRKTGEVSNERMRPDDARSAGADRPYDLAERSAGATR